jgi:hypothetical protein
MDETTVSKLQPSVDALAELFGFDPNELQLNRTGRLSGRQRHRFQLPGAGCFMAWLCVTSLWLAVVYWGFSNRQSINLGLPASVRSQTMALCASLYLAPGVLVSLLDIYRLLFPRLRTSVGPMWLYNRRGTPYLKVGGKTDIRVRDEKLKQKEIDPESFPGFYRLYYANNELLSIEPLGSRPQWD